MADNKDTYDTRRKKRPALTGLGLSPEAEAIKMKPAGTMRPFPKHKSKPKAGMAKLAKAEAAQTPLATRIAQKILGRSTVEMITKTARAAGETRVGKLAKAAGKFGGKRLVPGLNVAFWGYDAAMAPANVAKAAMEGRKTLKQAGAEKKTRRRQKTLTKTGVLPGTRQSYKPAGSRRELRELARAIETEHRNQQKKEK
jgi:hypothetical protein